MGMMGTKRKNDLITLTEELFLGKGVHKAAYIHPYNNNLCIKVPFNSPDIDVEKELAYRKTLGNKELKLLPAYYGEIDTNLGKGYVFERAVDFDNSVSMELKFVFENKVDVEEAFGCSVLEFLIKFRDMMLLDKIVVSDVDPANFMVVRLSPQEYTFKVVDNIGTPVMLPLAYYFDFVAEKRIKKYWNRFVDRCKGKYDILTSDNWNKLYA